MVLKPHTAFLAVVQATVNAPDNSSAVTLAYSMPAAPFGSAAWQLPVLAGYVNRLRRQGDDPTCENFADYMESRPGAAVPGPTRPYPYAPWHDDRLTLLIDLALCPGNVLGWPRISMVIQEQEPHSNAPSGTIPCGWARTTRLRGCAAVLNHTVSEISAEHARLADRARTMPGMRASRDLARESAQWARTVQRAHQADRTLAQAAKVRTLIKG